MNLYKLLLISLVFSVGASNVNASPIESHIRAIHEYSDPDVFNIKILSDQTRQHNETRYDERYVVAMWSTYPTGKCRSGMCGCGTLSYLSWLRIDHKDVVAAHQTALAYNECAGGVRISIQLRGPDLSVQFERTKVSYTFSDHGNPAKGFRRSEASSGHLDEEKDTTMFQTVYMPGFNCHEANTVVESAICRNQSLAKLDRQIADSFYRKLRYSQEPQREALISDQRNFLDIRNECGNDITCLTEVMRSRVRPDR